jgi:hypothetical protein
MENVGYNMDSPNLKRLLEMMIGEDEQPKVSREEKQQFLAQVKNFSEMGHMVYGRGSLEQITNRVKNMVDKAERISNENGDWFDGVTVKRHMKQLNESYKVFEQTAKEMNILQQRLAAAYEDIAQGLNRYFDVG